MVEPIPKAVKSQESMSPVGELSVRGLRNIALALGMGLASLAMVLAVRGVDWKLVRSSFAEADWRWVAAAVVCILFLVFARTVRWQLLFPTDAPRFWDLYFSLLGGQVTDTLLFARAGDAARVVLQKRERKVATAFTIVTEKVLDILAVILLGLVGMFALGEQEADQFPWKRMAAALSGVLGVVLAVLIVRARRWQPAWLSARRKNPFSNRIREMLTTVWRELGLQMNLLAERRKTGVLILVSLGIWIGGATVNYLLFRAFHFPLSFGVALYLLIVLIFGTALPIAPGRVGIFHYLCVWVLAGYSIDKSNAFSYAVLLHLIVFGTPLALFIVSLLSAGWIGRRRRARGVLLAGLVAKARVSANPK